MNDDDDEDSGFRIEIADEKHIHLAPLISQTMEESARIRGTGIAKRSPETIAKYMLEGNAVVAIHESGRWAGFCYLALWENGQFVSNSGLIVAPEFRDHGVAKKLKIRLFQMSRKKYPQASIVGITTSIAVMKVNTSLGFHATAFSEIPKDDKFWTGCKSCVHHDILERTDKKFCLCTAMRYDSRSPEVTAVPINSYSMTDEFH